MSIGKVCIAFYSLSRVFTAAFAAQVGQSSFTFGTWNIAHYSCGKTYPSTISVDVPADGAVRLCLDTCGHFTRVRLGGRDLGAVGWGDFSWHVPHDLRGQRVKL